MLIIRLISSWYNTHLEPFLCTGITSIQILFLYLAQNYHRECHPEMPKSTYLSIDKGKVVRFTSHVTTAGGFAAILQVNRATPPSWTSVESGWTSKAEMAKKNKNKNTRTYNLKDWSVEKFLDKLSSRSQINLKKYPKTLQTVHFPTCKETLT